MVVNCFSIALPMGEKILERPKDSFVFDCFSTILHYYKSDFLNLKLKPPPLRKHSFVCSDDFDKDCYKNDL